MSDQEWRSIDSLETLKNKDPSIIKWPDYEECDKNILLPMDKNDMKKWANYFYKEDLLY